jgi:hypothetical protein
MTGKRRRLDRWGFRAWILGMLLTAVGIAQGLGPVWVAGAVLLAVLLLSVAARTARDIGWPRRSPTGDRTDKR